MDPTIQINQRVSVITVFKERGEQPELCVPEKMKYKGKEIDLHELALRHPTVAGKRMLHVFHVSDGANGYRLEFDAEALTWTLVSMIPELP